MKRTPTLGEVIAGAVSFRQANMRVCLPARVESFDAASCTVTVTFAVLTTYEDEDDAPRTAALPTIPDVPYAYPRFGNARISKAPKPGDWVLVLFGERSLDVWRSHGGVNVNPRDPRMFDTADAIACPISVTPDADIGAPLTNDLLLSVDGGASLALTETGTVRQGAGGAHAAVAEKVLIELQKLVPVLSALSADMTALGSLVGVGATTATAISTALGAGFPADVKAPQVEVTP